MVKLKTPRLCCGVVFLAFLLAGEAAADMPKKLLGRLKEQTVMITVTHRDQSVVHGAGVVLCEQEGQAHALTAYRLLATEMADGRSVLRRPSRTEIRFFRDDLPAVVDERANEERVVTVRQVPEQDAVLLTFPLEQGLETTAEALSLGTKSSSFLKSLPGVGRGGGAGKARRRPVVWSLGYRSATENWAGEQGTLLPGGGLLYHSSPIVPGFSGGPLYTKRGALLGVNLRPVTAEEIGAEPGTSYGEALSILDILPAIGKWLPVECLRSLEMGAQRPLASRGPEERGKPGRRGVTLYAKKSFRGKNETFYSDDDNFRDNVTEKKKTNSVEVTPDCTVTLYNKVDFRGKSTTLYYDTPKLGATPIGNDAVSSLKVSCPPPSSMKDAFESLVAEEETADPERLKELAVMITVTSEEGTTEQGAGVVLCQEDGQTYVLTAHHVLAGKQLGGNLEEGKKALERSSRTEIKFFHLPLTSVIDDPAADQSVVTVHQVPEEDLALLSFPFAEELELTAFLGPPSGGSGGWDDEGQEVVAVGFPKSSATTWATERGTLLAGDGESVRHSAAVVGGFSGGPLLSAASGALVGINVERIAGALSPSGDQGGETLPMGEALPLVRILAKIEPWLPAGCLRAREARVSGYFQGAQADAYSHVPLVLLTEAEELLVWGGRDKFLVGDNEVTVSGRGKGLVDSLLPLAAGVLGAGILAEGVAGRVRTKQKFRFTLLETNDASWDGKCVRDFDMPIDLGFAEKVWDQHSRLTCAVQQKKGKMTVELEMQEYSASKKQILGYVKVGDFKIDIAESKPVTLKTLGIVVPAGYFFYVDDRIVGAVDTLSGETVWLHPTVTGEARSAFLLAAAALLLTL